MALPAGGVWTDEGKVGFFAADTSLSSAYLRCALSGDHTVLAAGAAVMDIGVNRAIASTAADPVDVLADTKQGTMPMVCAAAVDQNDYLWPAADGTVNDVAAGYGAPRWIALEAGAGAGSIVECLRASDAHVFLDVADVDDGSAVSVPEYGDFQMICTIVAGTAETCTVVAPKYAGQRCQFTASTVGAGGTREITFATAINQAANTKSTLAAAGDFIELVGIVLAGSLVWRVVVNDNTTLA